MADIETKLRQGARVAEVGCGVGWSSIFLAKHFNNVKIDGIDPDDKSIAEARRNAAQHGVADRVRFYLNTIEEFIVERPYDLVTAFECLHDLPYPVQALGRMREMANPGGTVFIADEAAGEGFSDNHNLMGRFCYNVRVLHCLPRAMVFPQAAGTGTAMSENTVRTYAHKAGYSDVSVLEIENPFFRFYKLTP
jgi:ubiquinone/menaquinone biosynthesis C-methylase UbiE